MQVKSIADCSNGSILQYFRPVLQNAPMGAFCNTFDFIKLPFVSKIFVLSIFEWPNKTGFTVEPVQKIMVHVNTGAAI